MPNATGPAKVVNKFRCNATAALEDVIIEAVINLLERSDGFDVAALFPILASAATQ